MGTLLDRGLIKKDFDDCYPQIVELMDRELNTAKDIYDAQHEAKKTLKHAPLHKNMPDVSGGLKWASELRQRLSDPMGHLKHLEHP